MGLVNVPDGKHDNSADIGLPFHRQGYEPLRRTIGTPTKIPVIKLDRTTLRTQGAITN